MQQYFISEKLTSTSHIQITGSDVHHISHVMRFSVGDEIIICDTMEHCYQAVIQSISTDSINVSVTIPVANHELPVKVDIAQALIRRERFEYMLQKATELGVHTIRPITMTNCIVKWNKNKAESKRKRWNTITKEASEQSHRSHRVNVTDVTMVQDLPFTDYDIVVVADEQAATSKSLVDVLQPNLSSILVIIGPEGGFHPKERERLQSIDNVRTVGLGPRILRSETASSYLLSVISYQYEMRNGK